MTHAMNSSLSFYAMTLKQLFCPVAKNGYTIEASYIQVTHAQTHVEMLPGQRSKKFKYDE